MYAIFTGFDSARYPGKSGALCDLLLDGSSLRIVDYPVSATWDYALARTGRRSGCDLHVWAIDPPLVV